MGIFNRKKIKKGKDILKKIFINKYDVEKLCKIYEQKIKNLGNYLKKFILMKIIFGN